MEGTIQKCKIVLLGDQSVGKTSIINRFIFDNFTGNQQPTVGVDFVSKTIGVQNKNLRMQLWDTAGQQRFHSLIPSYIKDCNAAIVVFDLTNGISFNNVSVWIERVREVRGDDALVFIVGNKLDMEAQRDVQKSIAQNKAKQLGCKYAQVSAKLGSNVKELFRDLAFTIIGGDVKPKTQQPQKQPPANAPVQNNTINLNTQNYRERQQKKEKKKGCC